MAEQEACAQIVADAVRGEPTTPTSPTATVVKQSSQGESLLLPLLRGLLDGPHDDGDRIDPKREEEELRKLTSSLDCELLEEVRAALSRLQSALKGPANDASAPRRRALLALAARLQAGLIVPGEPAVANGDRLDGCDNSKKAGGGRYARRKNRQARHTVGVSREELADARRLMEDDDVRSLDDKKAKPHILQKQISCGATIDDQETAPVNLNSILKAPKPDTSEPISFHTPAPIHRKQAPIKQSANVESSPLQTRNSILPVDKIHTSILKAAQRKSIEEIVQNGHESSDSEEFIIKNHMPTKLNSKLYNEFAAIPKSSHVYPNDAANSDNEQQTHKSSGRFNNKRTKMKRANTIDIPKPNNFFRVDSDASDDERRMNGFNKPKVPVFQPKTENDHKFLAFINKHNDNNNNQQWCANNVTNAQSNWSNCFGNIKNTFENHSNDHSRSSSASSARNFWKANDNTVSNRPLNNGFFDRKPNKSKFGKLPWTAQTNGDVVTASLKIAPPPPQSPIIYDAEPKKYITKPIAVNQFSHAPMSAFKPPISKKTVMSPTHVSGATPHIWSPPSLSSPKPLEQPSYYPQYTAPHHNIIPRSPVNLPWSQRQEREKKIPPYKERAFLPLASQEPPQIPIYRRDITVAPKDLSAPQLVRKMESLKQKLEPVETDSRIDAQKLQIEFYEKQILEKHRKKPSVANGFQQRRFSNQEPMSPQNYTYTVTDYTPPQVVSTFVPLQPTPDIEKIKSHDVEKLPDVVLNETKQPGKFRQSIHSSPVKEAHRNGFHKVAQSPPNYDPYSKFNNYDYSIPVEYQAVTRVMRGPVSQQAVIKSNVVNRNVDDQRDDAAKSLKGVLSLYSSPKSEVLRQIEQKKNDNVRNGILKINTNIPAIHYEGVISPKCDFRVRNNVFPKSPSMSPSSVDSHEEVLHSKLRIQPVKSSPVASPISTPSPTALSKSESWHQLTQPVTKRPSSHGSPSNRTTVARAKSLHLLSIPKQFEGGIDKDKVVEKRKTVEAYFLGSASPQPLSKSNSQQAIAEMKMGKTKVRQSSRSFSLGRSQTMPHIDTGAAVALLDESNVDDAFDDLINEILP